MKSWQSFAVLSVLDRLFEQPSILHLQVNVTSKGYLTNCVKVFTRMQRGYGPARKEAFGQGEFYEKVIHRCQYLITLVYEDGTQEKVVRGMPGLKSCITATEGMDKAELQRYKHLPLMKKFQFLMDDKDFQVMKLLHDDAVGDIVSVAPKATAQTILRAKGKYDEKDVFVVGGSSSSSKDKLPIRNEDEDEKKPAAKKGKKGGKKANKESDDEGLF